MIMHHEQTFAQAASVDEGKHLVAAVASDEASLACLQGRLGGLGDGMQVVWYPHAGYLMMFGSCRRREFSAVVFLGGGCTQAEAAALRGWLPGVPLYRA